MAFSQPLTDSVRRKGQTAMLCQLCETDSKLKWKCLECKLMMCQRCKDKVHAKIASADDHTVIDIREISKHQTINEPKPDLTKLKCEVHRGQNFCLNCVTCKELVCQICVTKTHNEHEFSDINEEYKIKMDKIRYGQKTIQTEMRTLTVSEQKLKLMKSDEQSNYDKVKQEIMDNDKALKDEIQKHTDKLLKELDQKWEAVSKYIDGWNKKLVEQKEQMQKQIQEINTLIHPANAKNVISGTDFMLKSIETNIFPENTSFQGVPKFTYGDKTKIPLILGKLEDVKYQFSTELQVDKRIKTDLKSITFVESSPDGFLWLCDKHFGVAQKVKQNGDNLTVICNYTLYTIGVHDVALLPSGDLLLSARCSSNLKLIPSGSTDIQDSVYTVSPLETRGVHVTCDNKVIVGAEGGKSTFPVDGPRHVIVMDKTGRHEKFFQYDRHNEPLFTYPFHITSNSQGYIAVVDRVSVIRGRVVVLDKEGEVRNIYIGHPDVNNDYNPFTPTDITTTPLDNFVLADTLNHTLHILNSEGEIITFYNTEEMGILLPNSLSFSTTGQLYIGCITYKDDENNADIIVINNFIF